MIFQLEHVAIGQECRSLVLSTLPQGEAEKTHIDQYPCFGPMGAEQ